MCFDGPIFCVSPSETSGFEFTNGCYKQAKWGEIMFEGEFVTSALQDFYQNLCNNLIPRGF